MSDIYTVNIKEFCQIEQNQLCLKIERVLISYPLDDPSEQLSSPLILAETAIFSKTWNNTLALFKRINGIILKS